MQLKRGSVRRTSLLAAIAVAATLIQLFPEHAGVIKWAVILCGLTYLLVAAVTTYPKLLVERRRRAAQLAADAREYRTYEHELALVRARFAVGTATHEMAPPADYQTALTALNERHRDMLIRKFGAC